MCLKIKGICAPQAEQIYTSRLQWILDELAKSGITQAELAYLCHLHPANLSRILSKKSIPSALLMDNIEWSMRMLVESKMNRKNETR